jgi:hypothetical protein
MEPDYKEDRTHFLKLQLQQLRKHKNSLSQITFVINHNPEEDDNYKRFVDNLPKEINGTPLVVLRRANVGMMFGVWFHVSQIYGETFDYYLVTEDDYVPTLNDFDDVFLSRMDDYDLLFSKIRKIPKDFWETYYGNWPTYLSIPEGQFVVPVCVIGLISSKCLVSLFNKHGELLSAETDYPNVDKGLIFFALNSEGYRIGELSGYGVKILTHRRSTHHNHQSDKWFCHVIGNGPMIFSTTAAIESEQK